jgi:hypothetical protein
MNPLYNVTNSSDVEQELLRAPDNLTNSNQYTTMNSSNKFFRLQYTWYPIASLLSSVKRPLIIVDGQKEISDNSVAIVSKKHRANTSSVMLPSILNQSVLYESGNLYIAQSTACVRDTGESIGNGLFTKIDLKQDEVIAEFSGVVLSDEEYDARLKDGRTKKGYSIELKKGLRLDCYENAKVCIHLVLIVCIYIYR